MKISTTSFDAFLDCKSMELEEIILDKVDKESIIHSDYWKGYDGLVDIGYNKHYKVKH